MATEKVQYIVEILKQGDGSAAAVADLEKVEAAAVASNTTLATGAAASSTAVKAGARDIKSALSIIAITSFPQAAQAGFLFKGMMDLTRASASALGIGITGMVTGFIAIPVAIGAAVVGFRALNEHIGENIRLMKLRETNSETYYALLKRLGELEKSGELTPEGVGKFKQQLEAAHSINTAPFGKDPAPLLAEQATAYTKIFKEIMGLEGVFKSQQDMINAAINETLTGLARQLTVVNQIAAARREEIEHNQAATGIDMSGELALVEKARVAQAEQLTQAHARTLELKKQETDLDRQIYQSLYEQVDSEKTLQQLRIEGLITQEKYLELSRLLTAATKQQNAELALAKFQQTAYFQILREGVQSFASGFSNAVVNALSGGKNAMREFFAQFFKQMAAAILQAILLKAIFSAISGIGGGSSEAIALATSVTGQTSGLFAKAAGGVVFAANGIQTVSQPTFLPRFNVVAGEAGPEMLTVLARPRMMDIGGIQAAVGNAGSSRLAITNAADLQNPNRGGGTMVIEVRYSKDTEARVLSNSIQGAVARVVSDMRQDSDVSRGIKGVVS